MYCNRNPPRCQEKSRPKSLPSRGGEAPRPHSAPPACFTRHSEPTARARSARAVGEESRSTKSDLPPFTFAPLGAFLTCPLLGRGVGGWGLRERRPYNMRSLSPQWGCPSYRPPKGGVYLAPLFGRGTGGWGALRPPCGARRAQGAGRHPPNRATYAQFFHKTHNGCAIFPIDKGRTPAALPSFFFDLRNCPPPYFPLTRARSMLSFFLSVSALMGCSLFWMR